MFRAERLKHTRILERGAGFKKRLIVRKFLDSLFQFNPDLHVRSAYADNPLDTERVKPKQIKRVKKIIGRDGQTMEIGKDAGEAVEASAGEASANSKRAESHFVKHIPPADTFHRWKYYTDVNYEEIRNATTDLYAEKPDLEFAINPYDQFEGEEEATKYVQKHKNEVIADILTLTNGKWNLCGSFKNNRERINFYNEKTAVVEEIFKQMSKDKKLGADLMRKRVAKKKKKNIEESGPDPEVLKQYRKAHPSGFEAMGAEDVSKGQDEQNKPTFTVSEECPYDAVQVDVFDFRQGGQQVKKSEFYTQAEEPQQVEPMSAEK